MVKLLFIALFTIIIINGQVVQGRYGNERVDIDSFTKVKHGAFVFN